MKRFFSAFMALLLCTALAACSNDEPKTYKLGMGVVVKMETDEGSEANVTSTVASVIMDMDGKIRSCEIDTLEAKMSFEGGLVEKGGSYKTKAEMGDDYGMREASGIKKEWYEQADYFEEYVVGRSADEISGIGGDEADLVVGCTIDVTDFKEAVVKAAKDEYAREFLAAAPELRVGIYTEDSTSSSAAEDAIGLSAMYSTFASVVTENGDVKAILLDQTEPTVTFNTAGEVGGVNYDGTKKEQGDSYGMAEYSDEGLEWHEQTTNFENYLIGTKWDALASSLEEPDLITGCTIDISPFEAALGKIK